MLDAPTEVVATGSRRTITVSWQGVEGAAGYTIAVRPANGTEPLEWVEHSALSSPHSISGKLVMSGLEYEVRVAASNADGQSEWSGAAAVTMPALRPAPLDAVAPMKIPSYHVGDTMHVHLHSQRPFENRSVWHWFLCVADGSDCKLLPVPKRNTYTYRVPETALGKLVKVQVDYDKVGISFSATSVAGIIVGSTDLVGVPTEVSATASNRQVTVSWSEVAGATGYRVSIRPKGGAQPLPWSEYLATAPPYTVFDYWVMSGLEHEVRVAAVSDGHQSEWSGTAAFTGPTLASAPPRAVEIVTAPPYRVGDVMHVSLASQHPFTARSVWHWFLCDLGGSNCKLLPLKQTDSHKLVIPEIARYKRVDVQSDYRKDGVFYTARVAVGVVESAHLAPAPVATPVSSTPTPVGNEISTTQCGESSPVGDYLFHVQTGIESLLYDLQLESVSLDWDSVRGGAVEPLCDDLLIATPWGRIVVVRPNGSVEHFDARVPMNLDELLAHPDVSMMLTDRLRVADILLKRHSSERWELFVSHHYFTGECIRFRLSSTDVVRDGNDIAVSPSWRMVFDADPCLSPYFFEGNQAGGRMLTDGPDHLLIVTGDHGMHESGGRRGGPQDPESHFGKLLRVEIETGDVEILAYGLRNPQGFVRDQDGNLWSTEHGPHGGDELNLLERGSNYGWPLVTYGIGYSRRVNVDELERVGMHDGFTKPVFSWVPSTAISSIIVNDGQEFQLWHDDLLVASLTGTLNSGLSLFRVRRDGVEVKYIERIELGWRIRDLTQMPDGRIALLSDDGIVHFMSVDRTYCMFDGIPDDYIYTLDCESEADSTGDEEDSANDETSDTEG